MSNYDQYFSYLKKRSKLGQIYRNKWLYPWLTRYLPGRTLDIGCGIGDMLVYRSNIVGVDINPMTVEYCIARGCDARLMTEGKLPFDDGEFDSVLLDNVLEHLEDPGALLNEIRRVLKKDHGVLLVGVPGRKGWSVDLDHKVFYSESDLVNCLEIFGFKLNKFFHTPLLRSSLLSFWMRQYCIYGQFLVNDCVGAHGR